MAKGKTAKKKTKCVECGNIFKRGEMFEHFGGWACEPCIQYLRQDNTPRANVDTVLSSLKTRKVLTPKRREKFKELRRVGLL